ncbi:MAG: alpha/beta superfamily hydrolase [Myxococcota bacterium]|jgi:alpha/beta superfamily hydrolase
MEQTAAIALPDTDDRKGCVLDGLFRMGQDKESGGAVIAAPHPLYGGSMESPVVGAMDFACEKAGIAALRFDWRGVGASAGKPSGEISDALEDYSAALNFLEDSVTPPLVAAGYSFGAATAILAAQRSTVAKLALVAPPPVMLDTDRLANFKGKIFIAVGDHDALASASDLEKVVEGLPSVEFHVLEDTDHFFMKGPGLTLMRARLTDWLKA